MSNKRLAHKVYYCGHCPSAEEEEALLADPKYGKLFQDKDFNRVPKGFDSKVDALLNPKPSRNFIAKDDSEQRLIEIIIDELEDNFGLDIDNDDADKFDKLNNQVNIVKSYIIKKIKNAPLSSFHKKELIEDIQNKRDIYHLLHVLYIKAHPHF
jgi:hypothetical protein